MLRKFLIIKYPKYSHEVPFLRSQASNIGNSNLLGWLSKKPTHLTNLPSNLSYSALNHSQISSASKSNPSIIPPCQGRDWLNFHSHGEDGSPTINIASAFGHVIVVKYIKDGIGGDIIDSRDTGKLELLQFFSLSC
ncbi:hypothetical protein O181_132394 [Austropuccinia psidii MF-1]|uniref:Uncharacterized protein n=1 Tax=Austropuccinia psidii MF-1 TaxID=1389203 RepID=A0A9Q3L4S9_9BASI|nr:hypothetical protein [Austropuccinia psidii MF-1]